MRALDEAALWGGWEGEWGGTGKRVRGNERTRRQARQWWRGGDIVIVKSGRRLRGEPSELELCIDHSGQYVTSWRL